MTDPDRELASKAGNGDRRALEELYERYRGRLLGFLVKTLGRRGLAEDVFQEVWIKVMHNLSSYDPGPGSFRAWLYRIAANAAVDRLRAEGRRGAAELDAPVGEEGERRVDRLPAEGPDPEAAGVGARLGEALDAALEQMREEQRAAVLLRHQQGLTYPEIAVALGVPEGTAKTMVHRGVRRLRLKLKRWRG